MIEPSTSIRAKLNEGRALIRPVSQVTVRLKPIAGQDRFDATVDHILRWMNKRAGRKLPPVAWERRSFELSDIGSQRVAAVTLATPRYWTGRLDDDDKELARRDWITEVGVGLDENGDVLFGARLICATRGEDTQFDRSIPGCVKQILGSGSVELDGELITDSPRIVASEADVDRLIELLERPSRTADVVILALPEGSVDATQTAISAESLLRQTQGVAHVIVLTGPASFFLSDRVGRELSTFRHAVRTYKPGFRSWIDEPSRHPLALPQRITSWNEEGPHAFERWLVNQILASSVRGHDREQRLPSFNTIRQLAAKEELKLLKRSGGSDAELLGLYEQDNEALRKELEEQKELYDGLFATADDERNAAVQELNAAKAQAFALRERIRSLEKQLASTPHQSLPPIPATLDGFEAWCREHLTGTIEMTPRSFQGIRKSEYHNVALIYQSLLLLRDHYVPMRLEGGAEKKRLYDEALAGLHLEESPTGDGINFDQDQYTVQWGGRRRALDRHLKSGVSREPRFCFRLYFFWDDESQIVVVGWLPSHLDNRAT